MNKEQMKEDKFKIHVNVGGFRLPLDIARDEEEIYRNAEKMVNAQLVRYQQRYNQRSAEEIFALAAYHLAVTLQKQTFHTDTDPVASKLEQLGEEVDSLLAE